MDRVVLQRIEEAARAALLASLLLAQALSAACGGGASARVRNAASTAPEASTAPAGTPDAAPRTAIITVLGTNDLHGRIERAAVYGGYVEHMRKLREQDGGLLVLEGGDLFQGTIESNDNEGASVIAAYNALGMTASSVGNHEFDFGPVGPRMAPASPDDDPRGALRARLREAKFPFLTANVWMKDRDARLDLPNVAPYAIFEVAGVKVGVVGLATEETLTTTMAANVRDLRMEPSADAVRREVQALRAKGAELVIGIGHLGGKCLHTTNPHDLSSCDKDEEVFRLVAALPPKTLDAFVGGHTHSTVAHFVGDVAVIESGAYGKAFGRVDFVMDLGTRRVREVKIHPPRLLCEEPTAGAPPSAACVPGTYEGAEIQASRAVSEAIRPYLDAARARRDAPLGVTVKAEFEKSGAKETALGNLLADLALRARPSADLALINGGGIRAPLPKGPLTYGAFFEVFPFDNRFATVEVTGAELRSLVLRNLVGSHAIISLAGVRAAVACKAGAPAVTLTRTNGKPVRDDERLTLLTSDFIVTGGDALFQNKPHQIEDGPPMREEMIKVLKDWKGPLDPKDPALLSAKRPRFGYPSRNVRCAKEASAPAPTAVTPPAGGSGQASGQASGEASPDSPFRAQTDEEIERSVKLALAAAERTRKHVLLEFVAEWCGDCREVVRVSGEPEVKRVLRERYVVVPVNVGRWDRAERLRTLHGVRRIATLVVLRADGTRLAQTTLEPVSNKQPLTAEALAAWLRDPKDPPSPPDPTKGQP